MLTPAEAEAVYARLSPEQRAEIDRLVADDMRAVLWRPQIGRQTEAAESLADITGYGGAAGGGKGLALDTPLPTPSGWTTMGEVSVGDELLDENGNPCRVVAESMVNHRPCFRIRFDDGAEIVADDVHRWVTFDAKELAQLTRLSPGFRERRRATRPSRATADRKLSPAFYAAQARRVALSEAPRGTVRDTSIICETLLTQSGRRNHAIAVAGALDLPASELPVDPYVLGVWLGDGTTLAATITTVDREILEAVEAAGHRIAPACKSDRITYRAFDLQGKLRALGVLGNKHIPQTYLRASMWQRLALLQGLMDTDGHCALDGGCQFDGTRKELIDGVHELVISLGIKPSLTSGKAKLNGRVISQKWRVSFSTELPAFRLKRKLERQSAARRTTRFRYVVGCDPAPSVPTKCIAVDSPTRQFLAGCHMVPTHNTDLIAGLSLTTHQRTVIFRKEKAQTEGIVQRLTELLGSTDGYNSQKSIWRTTTANIPRLIEFGGLDNPDDHLRWQGRPHDLIAIDEVTEARENQVRFVMGWNRTPDPKQRTRALLTFNPPTTAEGRWVIAFFAPWIDDKFANPAKPGELRWATTINGRDVWVDGPEPFVMFKGEPLYDFDPADFGPEKVIVPRSRTFIPSRVTDNYAYVKSGYIAVLQSMPEPLRSQMLAGDFNAGVEDDEWQVIPTAWIDAAMARWQPKDAKGVMDTLGCDPAMGGKDKFVLAPRYGTWFDQLIRTPGIEVPDGQTGAALVVKHRRDRAVICIDVVGWGSSTLNMLQEHEVQCHAVNGAAKSLEVSEAGLRFANYRSEIIWKMREALDPKNPNPSALPPDTALRADLAAYKWKMTASGIQVRSKDEMKAELGRSPDDGDAIVMANIPAMKNEIFEELREQNGGGFNRYSELPDYQPMTKGFDRYAE